MDDDEERPYDIALSFAGEDRPYVEAVADLLSSRGVRVFYDKYEEAALWGKDLYEHLAWVYGKAARFCVMFISEHYSSKLWTSHERRSAQSRAFTENREYILPARFDDSEIPGLLPTTAYLPLDGRSPSDVADVVMQKLGPRRLKQYFPPVPDRLFARMAEEAGYAGEEFPAVEIHARNFAGQLNRMTPDERELVFRVYYSGCPSRMPDNMHINVDYLRREMGKPEAEVVQLGKGINSLGFDVALGEDDTEHGGARVLEMSWDDRSVDAIEKIEIDVIPNVVVSAIVQTIIDGDHCEDCIRGVIDRADFSMLASKAPSITHHEDATT